jgi:hypothetical protein
MTPEGKIKKKVTDILKARNIFYFSPANNGFGKSGIPDIIACVHGQFLGIECKADLTKKPTELQVICGNNIKKSRGWWMIVNGEESLNLLKTVIEEKLRDDSNRKS